MCVHVRVRDLVQHLIHELTGEQNALFFSLRVDEGPTLLPLNLMVGVDAGDHNRLEVEVEQLVVLLHLPQRVKVTKVDEVEAAV